MPYDAYAALLRRGASPAYAKINDDTHRTLATDPLFARRVSQNSIARLLNTVAWALDDANRARQSAEAAAAAAAAAAPVEHKTSETVQHIAGAGQADVSAAPTGSSSSSSSAAQLESGMAELDIRTHAKTMAAADGTSVLVNKGVAEASGPATTVGPREGDVAGDGREVTTLPASSSSIPAPPQPPPTETPASATAATATARDPSSSSTPISDPSTTPTPHAPAAHPSEARPRACSPSQQAPASQAAPASLALQPQSQAGNQYQPAPYVQGMNVLSAPFLYASRSEPQAHACVMALLTQHIPTYITPTMSGVHDALALLDRLLGIVDPALAQFLQSRGLSASVYAFPSVLTLCACTPPLPEVLILWDFLLSWGPHLNLLAVVAQLYLIRDRLLVSDSPGRDLRSLGPLRATKVVELILAFVPRVPLDLWHDMVRHTGGGTVKA